MVIEKRFREQYEQQKAAEAKKKQEIEPPPLVEILQDTQQSELLAAYLDRENNADLAGKLLRKKIEDFTEQDLKELEAARQEVKRSYETAKSIVEKRLTPDRITLIAQSSPEFRKIVNVLGADKTKTFLEQYLARIAISQKTRLDDIIKNLQQIENAENSLKKIDQDAEKIRKRYGFREDEFVNALMAEDPGEAVKKLVREHSNFLGKWFGLGINKKVSEIMDDVNPQNIKTKIDDINSLLGTVGNIVGEATLKNPELRKLLVAELYEQAYGVKKEGMTFSFVEAARELPGKENIENDFAQSDDYKKIVKGRRWDSLAEAEQLQARNAFIENYLKKKKVGIFSIFYRLFKTMIEQMLNTMYPIKEQ